MRQKTNDADRMLIKAEQKAAVLDEQLKAAKEELSSKQRRIDELSDHTTEQDLRAKLQLAEQKIASFMLQNQERKNKVASPIKVAEDEMQREIKHLQLQMDLKEKELQSAVKRADEFKS